VDFKIQVSYATNAGPDSPPITDAIPAVTKIVGHVSRPTISSYAERECGPMMGLNVDVIFADVSRKLEALVAGVICGYAGDMTLLCCLFSLSLSHHRIRQGLIGIVARSGP
jgi:hypothetical protein